MLTIFRMLTLDLIVLNVILSQTMLLEYNHICIKITLIQDYFNKKERNTIFVLNNRKYMDLKINKN